MVRSLLDTEVTYREERTLDANDTNFDASLYEAEIYGLEIVVALGQAKHEFEENDIVYYPIYLISQAMSKFHAKIGVYEVSVSDAAINMDEEGEPDIQLLGEPLIFSFVTEVYLSRSKALILDKSKMDVPDEQDEEDAPDVPDVPDVPEAPDVPDVPDAPEAPDAPEEPKEMDEQEVVRHVDAAFASYGDELSEITRKDFKNRLYEVSGKTKSDFKKWKDFIKNYMINVIDEKTKDKEEEEDEKDEDAEDSVTGSVSSNKETTANKVYIREPVPTDGWCSMHAVDQFLKHVGVFDDIPGTNEVPLSLRELALPDNKYVTPPVQNWMEQFRTDQKLWNADFGDGNHSSPDAACEYIRMKTRDNYECLRNVFTIGKNTLPKEVRDNTRFTTEEVKNIINTNNQMILFRENPNTTTSMETDRMTEDQQVVIFINTGNHWEIIYSPSIPKVFIESPRPSPSASPEAVKVGSRVTWKTNGKVFEGEVVKITPKSYKICCKPNKTREEAKSLYMIAKENAKLNKNTL